MRNLKNERAVAEGIAFIFLKFRSGKVMSLFMDTKSTLYEKEVKKVVVDEIRALESKPLAELWKKWKELFQEEAPRHSRKYLIPRLAYRLQEKAYGGVSSKAAKRLEHLANRLEQGKRISSDKLPIAGTELILKRGEETHVMMVKDTGLIYRKEFYMSLSAVAREIMGMSYNGPLLFGLRGKKGS